MALHHAKALNTKFDIKKFQKSVDKARELQYNEYNERRKEDTPMTIHEAIIAYETLAFTHNYIYGFTYRHNVYFTFETGLDADACTFDTASSANGGGQVLRFRPTAKSKKAWLENATMLCSEAEWEAYVEANKHGKQKNRGIAFERILSERYGVTEWAPNNDTFDTAPDMVINGVGYQLKFERAQIIAMTTLERRGVAVA